MFHFSNFLNDFKSKCFSSSSMSFQMLTALWWRLCWPEFVLHSGMCNHYESHECVCTLNEVKKLTCFFKCHCRRKLGRTKRSKLAVYLHLFTVKSYCRSRRFFFFEILPHRDFGLSSCLKWPKFRASLGEHKRYLRWIPETLILWQWCVSLY